MNIKKVKETLAKVEVLEAKIDNLVKERDNLLLATCNNYFTKGESVTYLDKNNIQTIGKVIYHIGQKSLSVVKPDNTKDNCPLKKLVLE